MGMGIYQNEVDYSYGWTQGISYSASSTSDSAYGDDLLRQYADVLAERMCNDNIESIDKDYIAGMIYAILMKDDVGDEIRERLLDDHPTNTFKDEDFLI